MIYILLQHAFDSAGRLYNQQGKLEQWWTNTTSEGFNKVQACIVEQYSGMCTPFIVPKMKPTQPPTGYTIDDGKGGKIHVNVGC